MQIDYALILAAGLGTRMGVIGKKKPKPLWPIFNKTLLELQIRFCQELGIKRIYINAHYLASEIQNFIENFKEFEDVTVLCEDPLLDSGGAIHNLASRGEIAYTGNLLMINADQFMFFDKSYYIDGLNSLADSRASLFGIKVNAKSKYNEIKVEAGSLVDISKSDGAKDFVTYSGLGLLRLDGLKPIAGISKFFETVANYKQEKINVISPSQFEYWDFGTAEIYLSSIRKICLEAAEGKKTSLSEFLDRNKVLINANDLFFNKKLNSIDLESKGRFAKNAITFESIIQEIEMT